MLYEQGDLYGGQFDENRDSRERISTIISRDPEAILVCEYEGRIVGTVSLIDDGRVAWLFRFAVEQSKVEADCAKVLYEKASQLLRRRGHKQVLVYTAIENAGLKNRYIDLGMKEGNAYTCFWSNL